MDPARRTLSRAKTNCVAVVGGTHGNETNGVYLAKHFMANPSLVKRDTFETVVTLSNVASIKANRRFVETDMNRCFFLKDLQDPSLTSLESKRAKELDAQLGPKSSPDPKADFILDLHNTTANTGVALMMAPDDEFAHEVGAYLMKLDPEVRICNWATAADWPMLPTIGRSGMTFEVGACPWGCLVGGWYAKSRMLLLAALDFIDSHNKAIDAAAGAETSISVPVFARRSHPLSTIDYPRDENGELMGMIHPNLQDRDFTELKDGEPMFLMLDGSTREFKKEDYGVDPDEAVYPLFVNEAAYYKEYDPSKGIALMLATQTPKTVPVVAGSPAL
jgi:succinylglutamate desuccinylase